MEAGKIVWICIKQTSLVILASDFTHLLTIMYTTLEHFGTSAGVAAGSILAST